MNRLTQKNRQGEWSLKGVPWELLNAGEKITRDTRMFLYGALYKLMKYEDTGLSPEDVDRLDDFEQSQTSILLKELSKEQKKHQWIPVKEKLPEVAGRYLVTALWEDGGWRKYSVYDASYGSDGIWHTANYVPAPYRVVAWMPLPEPYRP